MDARTEQAILLHLREALKTRTVLVVSHRLSAVEQAQQILVLDKGRLVREVYVAPTDEEAQRRAREGAMGRCVITSYSIHYTKLYDVGSCP